MNKQTDRLTKTPSFCTACEGCLKGTSVSCTYIYVTVTVMTVHDFHVNMLRQGNNSNGVHLTYACKVFPVHQSAQTSFEESWCFWNIANHSATDAIFSQQHCCETLRSLYNMFAFQWHWGQSFSNTQTFPYTLLLYKCFILIYQGLVRRDLVHTSALQLNKTHTWLYRTCC